MNHIKDKTTEPQPNYELKWMPGQDVGDMSPEQYMAQKLTLEGETKTLQEWISWLAEYDEDEFYYS